MTEETQQPVEEKSEKEPQNNPVKINNTKREKCRPMTKVVIRRLPPTMTQEQFVEQVSPLPDYDYLYFAKADLSLGQHAFSRAYIDFKDQNDIFLFREKFDNYVFIDSKGTEFPSVVEFAPFQRIPKKRPGKKKDPKCGTIETDPYYISFLESLKTQEADSKEPQSKTEYSFQPSDLTSKKVTSTPLLDYLKQRKLEKQRIRDEKREEKRRRDLERKRIKEEAAQAKVTKVVEKESPKEDKKNLKAKPKKEDRFNRDKPPKEREVKITPNAKDRGKKYEDKRNFSKKDEAPKKVEEKRGKSYEKMRLEKKAKKNLESCDKVDSAKEPVKESLKEAVKEPVKEPDARPIENQSKTYKDLSECCQRLKETKLKEESFNPRQKTGSDESLNINSDMPFKKLTKRRSSLESGDKSGIENSGMGISGSNDDKKDNEGGTLRRHKSLDGENGRKLRKNENDEKDKDKKDPRTERRIRNKDRPAMEIYRPGMGRFSKQRMEREKGSEEKVTPSQSPTRSLSGSTTSRTPKSEVRTMTFKRSVSRDYT